MRVSSFEEHLCFLGFIKEMVVLGVSLSSGEYKYYRNGRNTGITALIQFPELASV